MAVFEKISITFDSDAVIGNSIKFQGKYMFSGVENYLTFDEKWVSVRAGSNQVSTNPATPITGERSAIDFVTAFVFDYGGIGFLVDRVENVVTITSTSVNYGDQWLGFDDLSAVYLDSDLNPISGVTFGFANVPPVLSILNTQVLTSDTDVCANVKLKVTMSGSVTGTFGSLQTGVVPISGDVFEYEIPRQLVGVTGFIMPFVIYDSDNDRSIQGQALIPPILNPDNFGIEITTTPNGGNIVIVNPYLVFTVRYSLDGITYQSENSFSSLGFGNYTIYFIDEYGCVATRDVNVNQNNINIPYAYISKNNSIRFAQRINFSTGGNYPNDENTLSCEAFARDKTLRYRQTQLFQSNDIITTQFRSNYENNNAYAVLDDGTQIPLAVVQKSNNIGITDMRDAHMYDLGNGKSGIYFTSGDIYDFDTMLATGETFALNGALPYWGARQGYVKVYTSFGVFNWYEIERNYYDSNKNAEVIVITRNTPTQISIQAGSIFNQFDYEIYEFDVDFSNFLNKNIQVLFQCFNDDVSLGVTFLSELINIKVEQEDTIELRYWNTDNTDVFYQTGITHLIRPEIDNIQGMSEGESENNKTDSTTNLISSQVYEADLFTFAPVTKEIWRKLIRAVNCKKVFINNVQRVINADPETELLGNTNLYVLSVNLIKTGEVFNSQSDGLNEFNFGNAEIVGLLEADSNNYIKY